MARPICGRPGMADCGGRHGMAGQGPFRRCRAQRSSQMRSSAAELVWEAPGVSAHCVETDPRSASGRDLHYLSWIGKNRAAPSAPRPWPSAETSSARGRRPLRIVKLVDDLRPSNRRLQAAENSLRMLNCWASVFSSVEESRARLRNKFGMNMSRSSLVLWADRRFAPPAVLSHHHTDQTSLPRRDASKSSRGLGHASERNTGITHTTICTRMLANRIPHAMVDTRVSAQTS